MGKATIKAYEKNLNEHDTVKELVKAYVSSHYGKNNNAITYSSAYVDMMSCKAVKEAVETFLFDLSLIRDGVIKKDNFYRLCRQMGKPTSVYINHMNKHTREIIEDEYTERN